MIRVSEGVFPPPPSVPNSPGDCREPRTGGDDLGAGQPSLDKTAGPTGSDILVQRRGVDCGGLQGMAGDCGRWPGRDEDSRDC